MSEEHGWRRFFVTMASGATRSSDINVTGYGDGNVIIPVNLRGAFRWRNRNADTGASGRVFDDTNTAVIHTVHASTKPIVMAIPPKVMRLGRILKLCTSSAPTGPKSIDVFLKF